MKFTNQNKFINRKNQSNISIIERGIHTHAMEYDTNGIANYGLVFLKKKKNSKTLQA